MHARFECGELLHEFHAHLGRVLATSSADPQEFHHVKTPLAKLNPTDEGMLTTELLRELALVQARGPPHGHKLRAKDLV